MTLNVMTFNVQCKGGMVAFFEGVSYDNDARSRLIANRILSRPERDRPDIIFLQEVFDETARENFIEVMKSDYPHSTDPMGEPSSEDLFEGKLTNSGLLVLSRFPFRELDNLPLKPKQYFRRYEAAAGHDALSLKGVGIVSVITDFFKDVTFAFTHMQSPYDAEDEHRDIRAQQLADMMKALKAVLGPEPKDWRAAVMLGDFNIRGDGMAGTDEFRSTFSYNASSVWAYEQIMADGWSSFMVGRSNIIGGGSGVDEGYTNFDFEKNKDQRLDYMLLNHPSQSTRIETHQEILVPHHMFVRETNLSDHFGLEAIIGIDSPFCSPAFAAVMIPGDASFAEEGPKVEGVRQTTFDFAHAGSLQWGSVSEPGTYSFYADPGEALEWEFYAVSDRSYPLLNPETVNYSDLPATTRDQVGSTHSPKVEEEGMRVACATPFYVRLRTQDGSTGPRVMNLIEHLGTTKETAVDLFANRDAATPSFPIDRRLGEDDMCWLRMSLPALFSGQPRKEQLKVKNSQGMGFAIELRDQSDTVLASAQGDDQEALLEFETTGGADVFLTVKRSSTDRNGLSVQWLSPVSYLLLNERITLYAKNETGSDRAGSDEIELRMTVDGKELLSQEWEGGADTGEYWIGLQDLIRDKSQAALGDVDRLGFVEGIVIELNEPDIDDHRVKHTLRPVSPTDANGEQPRHLAFTVPDSWSNGRYIWTCSASKYGQ